MKLSSTTIKILSNFASINAGVLFKKGNVQHTICPLSTITVEATFPDDFDKSFAIYDIDGFLRIFKTFSNPDVFFKDTYIHLVEEGKSSKFYYSDPSVIISPEKLPYAHDDTSLQFGVSSGVLSTIKSVATISSYFKYLRIWSTPEGNISLSLTSKEANERATNSYDIIVGSVETQQLKEFSFFYQLDNLKILEGDYDFVVSKFTRKDNTIFVLRMVNKTVPITYWTSLEV